MREIPGRRRGFTWPVRLLESLRRGTPKRRHERERSDLRAAALQCARCWEWPVLPAVGHRLPATGADRAGRTGDGPRPCACPRPGCPVPGAHPHDPGLLAATTDPRMVGWWWTTRPDAPLLLATGGVVCGVSLPAEAGHRALAALEDLGARLGPVVASPTRVTLLVEPYSLEELGELLSRQDWVPSSLRFHGRGGYVVLPPSGADTCWAREPRVPAGATAPWLPRIGVLVDLLVAAGASAPDGSRLAY